MSTINLSRVIALFTIPTPNKVFQPGASIREGRDLPASEIEWLWNNGAVRLPDHTDNRDDADDAFYLGRDEEGANALAAVSSTATLGGGAAHAIASSPVPTGEFSAAGAALPELDTSGQYADLVQLAIAPGMNGVNAPWFDEPQTFDTAQEAMARFAEVQKAGPPEGWVPSTDVDGEGDDLSQLDHDDNGEAGGSKPKDPPSLTNKNKSQLRAIAADEEVTKTLAGDDITETTENKDIVAAIEAKRAAGTGKAPAE